MEMSEQLKEGSIRLLVLGSGTSTGVPMIGCDCPTCSSNDSRDRRLRASVLLSWMDGVFERNILIDTSTDLRQQSLLYRLKQIDAVLFTHPHADHIHGIDELRSFNFIQHQSIPCYGSSYTLGRIRTMFDYIFTKTQAGGGKPKVTLHEVNGKFTLFGRKVEPLPAMHGDMEVYGFRIGSFAYLTDCNFVPKSTIEKMKGLKLLVLGAVQFKKHATHFSIEEAVELAGTLGADKTYLTHMNHFVKHSKLQKELPKNIYLSFDGMDKLV